MYLAYWDETLVGMCSVLPVPSGVLKNSWRTHRLVILPDFQGLGLGTKINEFIAEYYLSLGRKYYIRTSHLRLRDHMKKDPRWLATSSCDKKPAETKKIYNIPLHYDSKRICGSFEYVGWDYSQKPHMYIKIDHEINDLNKLEQELIELKKKYYILMITGNAYSNNDIDKLCEKLCIRTALMWINKTQNGTLNTFKNSQYNYLPEYNENETLYNQYKNYIVYDISNENQKEMNIEEILSNIDNEEMNQYFEQSKTIVKYEKTEWDF